MTFEETNAIVSDTIFNISVNATARTDKEFKDEILNSIYLISKSFFILEKIVNHADSKKVSDRTFYSQAILWQGSNSLMGSLQLIRQGYALESQFLMRYTVENLAMVLSFHTENGMAFYKKFRNNNLSGEKCIGESKKLVEQIGGIYGLLSEITHPSKKTLGYIYMAGNKTITIGGGVTDKTVRWTTMNFAVIQFLLIIYWSSIELIFHDYVEELTFWIKDGDLMKWSPNTEQKLIYERSLHLFKKALAGI